MDLGDVIRKDCCILLESTTKTEAVLELVELLGTRGLVSRTEDLKRDIFYREQLMSTGIGLGVGVPHVRYEEVQEPVVAVGVQPRGIADYGSIDDEPVRIVVMILVPPHRHKEHIRLLSLVVRKLKLEPLRRRLLSAADGEAIHAILAGSPE